jgi:hypothetical protein
MGSEGSNKCINKINSGEEMNNVVYSSLRYTNSFPMQAGDAETEKYERKKE